MKVKSALILMIIIMFFASPLFASAVTSATRPLGHLKWSLAVEDNYTYKRDIKKPDSRDKFDIEKINQVYVRGSLGLTPYFNIYAKLGESDCGTIKDEYGMGFKHDIVTNYGLLWGIGMSGAANFYEEWKVGIDAQFNWWKSEVDKLHVNGSSAYNVSGNVMDFDLEATPFVTTKIDVSGYGTWTANPYVGLKIAYFSTQTDGLIKYTWSGSPLDTSWVIRSSKDLGIVFGSDLQFAENFTAMFEARIIDESAITVGMTYIF